GKSVEVIEEQPDELNLVLGARDPNPALDRVLVKAGQDAVYAQRLRADPRAVVEEAFGRKLPPAARVRVHERAPGRSVLVIPAAGAAEGELSDLELDSVAGGTLSGLVNRIRDALCRDQPTGNTQDVTYSPSITVHGVPEMRETNRSGAGTYY